MAEKREAKVTFYGGTGSVTGSNFLLEADGHKILVDCGLTQGDTPSDENWQPFPYEPKEIEYLFITHAHVDHIGLIPKLARDGFRGKIFSTKPTKGLAGPMLEDETGILGKNEEIAKIFNADNIALVFSLWQGLEYHEEIKIGDNLSVRFLNSGHILGSAMVEFIYNSKKIIFTGDLGNSPSPILPDCEKVTDADYMIMESVYGDRDHESRDMRRVMLQEIIEDNHKRKGTLMMPTFSLERSQELLFEFDELVRNDRIPVMPIFFDSPLGIKLTEVFKQFKNYLNPEAQKRVSSGKYLFDFPGLRSTLETKESRQIAQVPNPKIIIAGSGMSTGGRIVHHEKYYLPDRNNTILLTGYQSPRTPGRMILEGVRTVHILGEYIPVRAHIATISGYSGHKDSDGLLQFVQDSADTLKKVFLVMGEPKSSLFLSQKLRDNLGLNAFVPERNDAVTLDC